MPEAPASVRMLLRSFAHTLRANDLAQISAYVLLSLAGALAGSVAALLLVPLVQPDHPLSLGFYVLDVHASVEVKVAMFLAATGAFALLRWQTALLAARLTSRYGMTLRRLVHARLIHAPLSALSDASSAEIANVLTHNVELIAQGFSALLQLLVAAVTLAVSLALAFWISPSLVLAAPVLVGLGLLASRVSGREQSDVSRQYVADMTRLFWLSEDFPRRWRHVRSFGREDAEKASYGVISARLGHGYRRQLELIANGRLMLEALAALGIAAIFIIAYRWQGIDQASLIAVCLLLGRLLPYLVSTRQCFQQLRSAVPAFDLWRRYTSLESSSMLPVPFSAGIGSGVLHIHQLWLSPPPVALEIRDLSLAPGELTLVSGDSGIGKSSLVDVLAGMAQPEGFLARVGEQVIDFDAYRSLVRHGAYVSQSVRPWQHTVRDSLLWAAPDATDEMMWHALADVGLDKRLATTHHGLDTTLHSSTSRLSGGELQRLLLAQVILRQPFMALLDEATSALDPVAEIVTLSALKRRLPHTIIIVVSHRASVAAIAEKHLTIGNDVVATVAG